MRQTIPATERSLKDLLIVNNAIPDGRLLPPGAIGRIPEGARSYRLKFIEQAGGFKATFSQETGDARLNVPEGAQYIIAPQVNFGHGDRYGTSHTMFIMNDGRKVVPSRKPNAGNIPVAEIPFQVNPYDGYIVEVGYGARQMYRRPVTYQCAAFRGEGTTWGMINRFKKDGKRVPGVSFFSKLDGLNPERLFEIDPSTKQIGAEDLSKAVTVFQYRDKGLPYLCTRVLGLR
jgi:hypothetical protein